MKKVLIAGLFLLGLMGSAEARRRSSGYESQGSGSSSSYEKVEGYQKRDGTYVEPYYRTKADNTLDNNYGTRGNDNPWTGKRGSGDTDYDRQEKRSGGYGFDYK